MKCLSPISIPRPNGQGAKDRILVPCSKCVSCIEAKRSHWTIRLKEELKVSTSALFLTLTYNDENIVVNDNDQGVLLKRDIQLFLKRLRRKFDYAKKKYKIRYFVIGEYGTQTQRPHYHMILFNVPLHQEGYIVASWEKGWIHFGTVEMASIHYCTGYLLQINEDIENRPKAFALMSKGLGKNYLNRMGDYHSETQNFQYTFFDGVKQPLPRYYKDKIFSSADKERNNLKVQILSDKAENDLLRSLSGKVKNPEQTVQLRTISYAERRLQSLRKNTKI